MARDTIYKNIVVDRKVWAEVSERAENNGRTPGVEAGFMLEKKLKEEGKNEESKA